MRNFESTQIEVCNFENSGDTDTSLMPFVIAPQRRRHSLWLPSPLNSLNSGEPGILSYDPTKDKVLNTKCQNSTLEI